MSLFTKLFPKTSVGEVTGGYLDMLTGYNPTFRSFNGGMYEAELCRASIHSFALQASKLKMEASREDIKKLLEKPNKVQVPSQFLYKLATTLECENTAFIFPVLDRYGEKIVELYPINPSSAEVIEHRGILYVKCQFPSGATGVCELSRVGVLTKFQYKNPYFGATDNPLLPTMQLIDVQNQGIANGVKASAGIRFIAKIANVLKDKDIEEERKKFVKSNLSTDNNGGVMMFDAKYSDVKQITSTPFVIDSKQMELINENVFTYFGTNKKILMNDFDEESWNAYYEAKVEPFAIQLSQVLTNMLYTERELGFKNYVEVTANRLQYASNKTKLDVVTQLMDRGLMTANEAREVFQLPYFEDGDTRYIRLEYTEADNLNNVQGIGADAGGAEDAN